MIYEFLRQKYLKRKTKTGFNENVVQILSVFSAFSIHFHVLKSGPYQKYTFVIDDLGLQTPKWVIIIEKITPVVFSRGNLNPLSEEDYF